jgi:hypothetical protein
MNVIVAVEKVIGHVIAMKEEDQEVEAILQEEDILLVDQDQEVTQVDLVQDLDLDPDPDLVRVVLDPEVILDHTLVIVEAEEDLEVVPYVALEVVDLAPTPEIDHILVLNPHVLDQEADLDQNLHLALDLAPDLQHTIVHVLVHTLDLVLDLVLVLVQDLIPDLHLLNQIHQLEVKTVKNQWMKINQKLLLKMKLRIKK